jgi:hypothetical protein
MLLAAPQFSSFLDELSVNGLPASQSSQPQQQSQQQLPAVTKELNANRRAPEFQMPQNPLVGMVMVPNQGIDVSTVTMNNPGWNSGIDINFGNPSVFAVLEVPEGPVFDAEMLSGKSSNFVDFHSSASKEELPCLERPPVTSVAVEEPEAGVANPNVELDESDPAFALFVDSPAPAAPVESSGELFSGLPCEKASPTFHLVVEGESDGISISAMHRFESLCHSIEAAFQRVSLVTSHL